MANTHSFFFYLFSIVFPNIAKIVKDYNIDLPTINLILGDLQQGSAAYNTLASGGSIPVDVTLPATIQVNGVSEPITLTGTIQAKH